MMQLDRILTSLFDSQPELRGSTDPVELSKALESLGDSAGAKQVAKASQDEIEAAFRNWFATAEANPTQTGDAKRVSGAKDPSIGATTQTASLHNVATAAWTRVAKHVPWFDLSSATIVDASRRRDGGSTSVTLKAGDHELQLDYKHTGEQPYELKATFKEAAPWHTAREVTFDVTRENASAFSMVLDQALLREGADEGHSALASDFRSLLQQSAGLAKSGEIRSSQPDLSAGDDLKARLSWFDFGSAKPCNEYIPGGNSHREGFIDTRGNMIGISLGQTRLAAVEFFEAESGQVTTVEATPEVCRQLTGLLAESVKKEAGDIRSLYDAEDKSVGMFGMVVDWSRGRRPYDAELVTKATARWPMASSTIDRLVELFPSDEANRWANQVNEWSEERGDDIAYLAHRLRGMDRLGEGFGLEPAVVLMELNENLSGLGNGVAGRLANDLRSGRIGPSMADPQAAEIATRLDAYEALMAKEEEAVVVGVARENPEFSVRRISDEVEKRAGLSLEDSAVARYVVAALPEVDRPALHEATWEKVRDRAEKLGLAGKQLEGPEQVAAALLELGVERTQNGDPVPEAERNEWVSLQYQAASLLDFADRAAAPYDRGRGLIDLARELGLGRNDFKSIATFWAALQATSFETGDSTTAGFRLRGMHRSATDFTPKGWQQTFQIS